jgi:hypothetical protein
MEKLPKTFSKEIYVKLHERFWCRPQIQPIYVRDLLNLHGEVFQREDSDSVENDLEVVDLSVNETNIEGLDGTSNIDHIKRFIDGRDIPTDCDPLDESLIRPVRPLVVSSRAHIFRWDNCPKWYFIVQGYSSFKREYRSFV